MPQAGFEPDIPAGERPQTNALDRAATEAGLYIILLTCRPIYRVIHKSLRDFRTRLRNNQDRHGRKEHINRERDTPSFCPTLQVLDMCTLGDF